MAACPDLDLYVDVIAAHRRAIVTACVGASSSQCDEEQAKLATLEKVAERCKAGENVGPPEPDDTDVAVEVPPPPQYPSGSIELVAGVGHGIAEDGWRGAVDPSPTIGIRAGGAYGPVGLLLSLEWTDVHLHSVPTWYPPSSQIPTMERLRYLAHVQYEWRPAPELGLNMRAGLGLETLLAGYENAFYYGQPPRAGTQHVDVSDTGIAFEVGVAGWYRLSDIFDVGAAIAIPLAFHGSQPEIMFPNAVDVQAFLGLRFNRR